MPEVKGKIVDADTKKPLAFVTIGLDGKVTSTNTRGEFNLLVPPGEYVLRIRTPFHEPFTKSIRVVGDVDLGEIMIRRLTL